MNNNKNILIVGAGLAGSCLAHRLLDDGHHITIIDKGENHATSIAAGMVNPMVFRRMNKSWRLDESNQLTLHVPQSYQPTLQS